MNASQPNPGTEIIIDLDEKLVMDGQGRWRLIDTACKINTGITEAEAIDVLIRRSARIPALRPLIRQHFPMYGFHA